MKHQLTYWIMPLVLGFAFVTGCQQKEKPAADRVHEMLADSSSRAMVEQNICTDHQMSMEMMNHLMVQARTDTAMCSNIYKTMMADSAMNCRMQMSMGSSMRGSSMGGSSMGGSSMGGSSMGGSSMGGSAMGGSCNMPSSSMMKDSKTPDHSVRRPKSGSMKMKM